MPNIKSERNKTIDFLSEENPEYLAQCIRAKDTPFLLDEIRNTIIFGDFFTVTPFLPHSFVDLLIADPLTTLTKHLERPLFIK